MQDKQSGLLFRQVGDLCNNREVVVRCLDRQVACQMVVLEVSLEEMQGCLLVVLVIEQEVTASREKQSRRSNTLKDKTWWRRRNKGTIPPRVSWQDCMGSHAKMNEFRYVWDVWDIFWTLRARILISS